MGPFLSYSPSKYLITCLPILTLILSDRCSLSSLASVARQSFQRWVLNSLTTPSTSLVVVLVPQV